MNNNHIIEIKTPLGSDSSSGNPFVGLDSIPDHDKVKDSEIEFMLRLVMNGIRNKKGECDYEGSRLTWEFIGDIDVSLVDTFKDEFSEQLQKNNINAIVKVKECQKNKIEVWVVHNTPTPLETDIKVNSIYRRMEKQYSNLEISLFMATEEELAGHDIISS